MDIDITNYILIINSEQKIIKANSNCQKLGYSPKELEGKYLEELLGEKINLDDTDEKKTKQITLHGKQKKSIHGTYTTMQNGEETILSIQETIQINKLERKIETLQDKLNFSKITTQMSQHFEEVAHNLKNKLAPIAGFSELLILQAEENEKIPELKEMMKSILDQSQQALKLIHYYMKACKYRPEPRRINLNETINQIIVLNQSEIKRKTIKVETQFDKTRKYTSGIESEILFALFNVFKNSCNTLSKKDRPRKIKIKTYAEDEEYIIIDITDNGPKKSEEEQFKIFEPQFTNEKNEIGVDLNLSRDLITKHNGLMFYDTNYTKGSKVKIVLPLLTGTIKDTCQHDRRKIKKSKGKGKILIINEEEHTLNLYTKILDQKGYTINQAQKLKEGLAKLLQNEYDAIICDLHLNENGSTKLYKIIKKLKPGYEQKLILTSKIASTESNCIHRLPNVKFYFQGTSFDSYKLLLQVYQAVKTKI